MRRPSTTVRSKAYPNRTVTVIVMLGVGLWFYIATHTVLLQYIGQMVKHAPEPLCKNCNVIVISLDTLSALHLPCYGYSKNTAPNLCAFAARNVWFPNSYSQSFFTLPSHASLFTSLYPSNHGMLQTNASALDPSRITLAQTLQHRGYATLYFGPTNSEEFPLDRGFGRGFTYIDPEYTYERIEKLSPWYRAINMLKKNQALGKPTFLFLHTYYVHEPYLPDTRTLHFTTDTNQKIPVTIDEYFSVTPGLIGYAKDFLRQNPVSRSVHPTIWNLYQTLMTSGDDTAAVALKKLMTIDCPNFCLMAFYYYKNSAQNPRAVAFFRALYDELILQLDAELQKFLLSIQPLLDADTILVITADHGEGFMEHGSLFHTSLYNEILRVPLIFSIPRVPANTVRIPAQTIDIYPTLLRFLGLQPEQPVEGTDLTPAMLGIPSPKNNPPIVSELYNMLPSSQRKILPLKQKTIIAGRWKLYVKDTDNMDNPTNLELYDSQNDAWDMTNLAARYPKITQQLLEGIRQFMENHSVEYPAPTPIPSSQLPKQAQQYFHY